jgi:hypothetical protein
MTIPGLVDGLLPAGVHDATMLDVQEAFGLSSDRRMELFDKLSKFLDHARAFSVFKAIYLDESFVTDKPDPGCVFRPS